jgi:MFS family permease
MTAEATPKRAWTITGLLFLCMLVNFADKAVVGLAAVPIMQELELTPKQFGLVGSSFFFLFSLSAILVGFVANRVADIADRRPRPRRNVRRDSRPAGAQLDHRQLFVALGVFRIGHGRTAVGAGLAAPGPRRTAHKVGAYPTGVCCWPRPSSAAAWRRLAPIGGCRSASPGSRPSS